MGVELMEIVLVEIVVVVTMAVPTRHEQPVVQMLMFCLWCCQQSRPSRHSHHHLEFAAMKLCVP